MRRPLGAFDFYVAYLAFVSDRSPHEPSNLGWLFALLREDQNMESSVCSRSFGSARLGFVTERADIESSLGPFKAYLDYTTVYPSVVVEALINLYCEYNRTFVGLVAANREWNADYQYCNDGVMPVNWVVQIDMLGLDETFLAQATTMCEEEVREMLRQSIFEIENSIAMYSLLGKQFSRGNQVSFFSTRFRAVLEGLRQRFGRPITLLATTEEKYASMLATEFGKTMGEVLTDAEVRLISGFDTFFGPYQFQEYLAANGGLVRHLLYVRSSDPPSKLKRPDLVVSNPLLDNEEIRRLIKANALTLNLDAPDMAFERRINDTKGYMLPMGMAFPIMSEADLYTLEGDCHRYTPKFEAYLRARGADPHAIAANSVALRCKPEKGAYGCYGHLRGCITDRKFRSDLRKNMGKRGDYVVQLEMEVPTITNGTDGTEFAYIDRNFIGTIDGQPMFLGGVRTLMPVDSEEVRRGRIHGNALSVFAEIVG